MPSRPPTLLPGTVLQDRYDIRETLGQGTFGITYLARDLVRQDACVVRELAPAGAIRDEQGILFLSKLGESPAQRLRQRFLHEARSLMRCSGATLPAIRGAFSELGTAYLVREYIPQATSLRDVVLQQGPLDFGAVQPWFESVAADLDRLHREGILHLDLRPSNVLLTPKGHAYLIDFGAARKWHRDLFSPLEGQEFGAPELARRGSKILPQTDVFGVAQLVTYAISGLVEPASLRKLSLMEPFERALERALSDEPHLRPRFASALLPSATQESEPLTIEAFDKKALALKQLRFDRRECPSCHGVLESPKPLRKGICPVCHEGTIRVRKVEPNLCPNCRMGFLKELPNEEPLAVCPICSEGLLHKRRRSLFSKEFTWHCDGCEAVWRTEGPTFVIESSSDDPEFQALPAAAWREISGRSHRIRHCAACGAQYDLQRDGRWRQVVPAGVGKFQSLEADEWARVAAGLPPDCGNAECDACGADYFLEGERAALLATRFDPHHFAASNTGRFSTLEELRWLGVGKESPHPGLACTECETEFDMGPSGLKLVRSQNPGIVEHLGRTLSLEDWHRAGRDLPLAKDQKGFEEAFEAALRQAFSEGALPFSDRDEDLLWKSHATRYEQTEHGWQEAGDGQLQVTRESIALGGMIKKWRHPLAKLEAAHVEQNRLDLEFRDGEREAFEIQPVSWSVRLESGTRTLKLGAWDLMMRLQTAMRQRVAEAAGV